MAVITVVFDGDSAPLVAAAGEAGAAFTDMAATADAATTDIASSMADLASSMDGLQASVDALSASMDSMAASSDAASASVDDAAASADAAGASAGTAAAEVLTLSDVFDTLTGNVGSVVETFGMLVAVMGTMTIINDVSSWVENLIQQMFSLDEQTQKTVNSWQYLFANAPGGGKGAAQSLAQWAYTESPNLPFTAMDLRGAVSTLGTAGYSPQTIEQFIPYLADIASTLGTAAYGGQGVTLSQAANAIRSAGFGLTRMLRTDLGISPSQLVQYGLDATVSSSGAVKIKDMSTLIPALEAFVKGRGLTGAAQEQETSTFWGAWSSFQDYVQNFLQTMGGISPQTGKVQQGSFFGTLQDTLININGFLSGAMTTSSGPTLTAAERAKANLLAGKLSGTAYENTETPLTAQGVVTTIQQILGGGTQGIQSLVGGFLSGLTGGGGGSVATDLFNKIKDFGEWLSSSDVQAKIHELGKDLGDFMGQALQLGEKAMPGLVQAFKDLVKAIGEWWNSFTPAQQNSLKGFLGDIIQGAAGILEFASHLIEAVAAVQKFATTLGDEFIKLEKQFKTWGEEFISNLISGIEGKLSDLGGVINKVANAIASKLHFSKPDEGPLADSDRWMPDMMLMFASGIQQGLPAVARASQIAAATIAGPIHGMVGGGVANTSYSTATNYGPQSNALTINGANQVETALYIQQILQKLDREHNTALQQAGGFGYRSFGPVG